MRSVGLKSEVKLVSENIHKRNVTFVCWSGGEYSFLRLENEKVIFAYRALDAVL
jgi:hypothetical protein